MDILIQAPHLRKVLRTGQNELLSIHADVIGALIDTVQGEIFFGHGDLPLGILIDQMTDIFPVQQIFAPCQNQISISVLLLLFRTGR